MGYVHTSARTMAFVHETVSWQRAVYVPCELSPRITVPTERAVETFVVYLATRVNILTSLGNGTEGTVAKFNVAMAYAYIVRLIRAPASA